MGKVDTIKFANEIDRMMAIEEEVKRVFPPRLNATSSEDMDDLYQEKLEYSYWRDETEDEFNKLAKLTGINKTLTFNS